MDCLEILKELIKFKSFTKEESNRAIYFCKEILEKEGLKTQILENEGFKTLVCNIGKGDKKIILNGHLDVVPGNDELFMPYEKEGKLYGRGSADMKAGVAAMICALISLKNKDLSCEVELQLVTDEETGGFNCSKYLVDKGFRGDFVLCGEPTNLGIGVQAKGILQFDLEFKGKSAHGSRPWLGDNAILKAYKAFQEINKLPFAKESSDLYENPSINLSKIEGGDVYNKVPDYCKMSLDIRFLPEQKADDIIRQIEECLNVKVKIHSIGDPVKTKLEDKYVKNLEHSIKNITKSNVSIFGQHGSADTRFYSKYEIPAVEFGPSGENWHGDGEFVYVDSIYIYKDIIEYFITNI